MKYRDIMREKLNTHLRGLAKASLDFILIRIGANRRHVCFHFVIAEQPQLGKMNILEKLRKELTSIPIAISERLR